VNWLNYHHLLYFKVIANEGGIAKAAEKLQLGQPTLSTQLKKLEERLGHPLFDRRNRRLILTEAGRVVLEYADEIFRLGDEMVEAVQDRLVSDRTHLQIGILDSLSKSVAARLTQAAQAIGPCTVTILEDKGDALTRELLAHRIDLMLSNYQPAIDDRQNIQARLVSEAPVGIYGAPEFKKLSNDFPQSLDKQPFVMPTRHSKIRHDIDHFLKSNHVEVEVTAETQDTALQKILGTNGVGLIPLSEPAAIDLVRAKSLTLISDIPGITEQIWLISANRRIENPIAAELMQSFQVTN
jgi:LysR family transcriptional activator of nhaA